MTNPYTSLPKALLAAFGLEKNPTFAGPFITGHALFERWQLRDRDFVTGIVSEYRKGTLRIYTGPGWKVLSLGFTPGVSVDDGCPVSISTADETFFANVLKDLKSWRFVLADVQALEAQHPMLLADGHIQPPEVKAQVAAHSRAKARLKEIAPVIDSFFKALYTAIKNDCSTLTGLDADTWRKAALLVFEQPGAWNETIKREDLQQTNFGRLATTEHREREPVALAQIILAREGLGRVSRKELVLFFDALR